MTAGKVQTKTVDAEGAERPCFCGHPERVNWRHTRDVCGEAAFWGQVLALCGPRRRRRTEPKP